MTWADYDSWNSALAERLFNQEHADLPVYVDINEVTVRDCATVIGISSPKPEKALIRAVRSTLGLDSADEAPLAEHVRRYQAWRRKLPRGHLAKRQEEPTEPPPVIALLAVLVIAAQRMGMDTNQAPHAYYPRLAELLELSERDAKRLKHRFPVTETFWRGLNDYLSGHEGYLGLPTAYALGHRFVGIPQSQALVRAGDRAKLPVFFSQFGLAPGSELIPADLERMLDAWIPTQPSPVSANLQRLWKGSAAKERISGVAAVELSLWDGSVKESEGSIRPAGDIAVTALMRQTFGGRSVEFSLAIRFPTPTVTSSVRVLSAEGHPSIGVIPSAGSRLLPIGGTRLDPASVVGAVLEIEDGTTMNRVERRPRRVVPFRKDELLGLFMETKRIQLAEDTLVLVKDEPRLLQEVLQLIDDNGRRGATFSAPGAGAENPVEGVPEGWVLVEGVQLYGVPQGVVRVDLQVLVPQTTAQLTLAGGLKLPGRVRKWSRLQPPEIRAAVAEAESLRLVLKDLTDEPLVLEEWTVEGAALARSLDNLSLEDGDYEIELFVNNDQKAISATTMRLRSADTPDVVSWTKCARLNYELDRDGMGAIRAAEASEESEWLVDGLNAIGESPVPPTMQAAPVGVGWSTKRARSGVEIPVVVLGTADPKSCVVTGAHYMEVSSVAVDGKFPSVCRDCGVQKAYPARPRWKKPTSTSQRTATAFSFDQLAVRHDTTVSWDDCIDALVHVGGGPVSTLERIASQAEGSSLFIDGFIRTLETLGHLDIRRDDTLNVTDWEANPAYLAETSNNGFVLAGVWSDRQRSSLREAVEPLDGSLITVSEHGGPTTWLVRGLDSDTLRTAVGSLDPAAYVVPNAVERLLHALPPLSELEAALPTRPIPEYEKATIFDPQAATWRATPGVGVPGAYRLEQSFKRLSIWVSHQGAVQRTAQVGTVQLVKHLAAKALGRPLIGYLESSRTLIVPMGAELPGLYGRAAALCSGQPPRVSPATRSIGYQHVPRPVADRLCSLLLS